MSLFPNLDAELARRNIKRSDIARDLYRGRVASVSDKLNGKYPLSIEEALMIKNKYFPNLKLDYLFDIKEDASI